MDTLGIEPRASRMLSGCDTTTPRALEKSCRMASTQFLQERLGTDVPYIGSVAFLLDLFQNALCDTGISGLVVEYIVAIEVTRVRFPADAILHFLFCLSLH